MKYGVDGGDIGQLFQSAYPSEQRDGWGLREYSRVAFDAVFMAIIIMEGIKLEIDQLVAAQKVGAGGQIVAVQLGLLVGWLGKAGGMLEQLAENGAYGMIKASGSCDSCPDVDACPTAESCASMDKKNNGRLH